MIILIINVTTDYLLKDNKSKLIKNNFRKVILKIYNLNYKLLMWNIRINRILLDKYKRNIKFRKHADIMILLVNTNTLKNIL